MDMHADMVATKRSPKVRPLTIEHLDRRTRGSKRARALAAELARGWDGITEVQRQAVERAGMLCALAEDLLARRLAGQPVPMDEVLRAEGVARRAVRAIVAERPAKPRGLQRARARWEADEKAKAAAQAAEAAGEATAKDNTDLPDARVE
jgi:hypothetical protein